MPGSRASCLLAIYTSVHCYFETVQWTPLACNTASQLPTCMSSFFHAMQSLREENQPPMHNRGHVSTFHWPFWYVGSSMTPILWPSVWPGFRPIESCHVALNPQFIKYVLTFALNIRIIPLQLCYNVVCMLNTLFYRNTCFNLVNNYWFIQRL
jgi:hypothetical protein